MMSGIGGPVAIVKSLNETEPEMVFDYWKDTTN